MTVSIHWSLVYPVGRLMFCWLTIVYVLTAFACNYSMILPVILRPVRANSQEGAISKLFMVTGLDQVYSCMPEQTQPLQPQ